MRIEIDGHFGIYYASDLRGILIDNNLSLSEVEQLLTPSSYMDFVGNCRLGIFATSKKRILNVFPDIDFNDYTFD